MRSFIALPIASVLLASLLSCSDEARPPKSDHWTVINYWAIWCKPCREEIPELNQLNKHVDIDVFGVNFDRKQGAALQSDALSLGLEFENVSDPSQALGIERPNVLPTTIVIAPSGEVTAVLTGPQTRETILAVIRPTFD